MEKQEKYNSQFATNLRGLIAQKGTTITALSKALGISRQAVSQYTDGTGQPNVDKLVMIADYFGVSADYLVGLSDTQTTNETIRGIHEKTGLWEEAISFLMKGREMADFISFLTINEHISDLVKAVKQKNEFTAVSRPVSIKIGDIHHETDMQALFKMLVSDLFFEIIDGYTAKQGEIMVEYKVGGSNS